MFLSRRRDLGRALGRDLERDLGRGFGLFLSLERGFGRGLEEERRRRLLGEDLVFLSPIKEKKEDR